VSEASIQRGESQGYWFRRGANFNTNSAVPWTPPTNLSRFPSWVWPNPLNEQVRHSPLIDADLNVYISTGTRMYKFSKYGLLLWTWQSPDDVDGAAEMAACPSLYENAVLAVLAGSPNAIVYSISQSTGIVNWRRSYDLVTGRDASATLAFNDTLIFAARNQKIDADKDMSNRKVVATDIMDGTLRWEYEMEDVVWNFAPSTPGDGTLLFSTACGTVFKLDFDGQLVWRSGEQEQPQQCSTGGGALGPNGVFYNQWSHKSHPGTNFAAYQISDGRQLWRRTLDEGKDGAAQYPAVGRLGPSGPLAMLVAVGDQPMFPALPLPPWSNMTYSSFPLRSTVVALHADTGEELWRSAEPAWPREFGAGDDLKSAIDRSGDVRGSPLCWPDVQGIPLIAGDGTVFASSSLSGVLRAIRDRNGDGKIEAAEVSAFSPHEAFLNSPSVAPGMLVAAPCWGPVYAFLGP